MRGTRGPEEHHGGEETGAAPAAVGKRARTEAIQKKPAAAGTTPPVLGPTERAPAADAFDFSFAVQRKGEGGAPSDPESVGRIAEGGLGGGGGELPHRAALESGFGVDLSGVRAHTGVEAAGASRAIGAEAYTMGADIAFATPAPSQALVAHEVAHVIQQSAGAGPASGVGEAGDSFEREADTAAATVAAGGTSDLAASYPAAGGAAHLQRRAVQRYESAEHAMIGDGMAYPVALSPMELPNHACVTRGELVALGDFYGSYEALRDAPREETEAIVGLIRWEAIWTLAGRQKAGGDPINDPASPTGLETAAHPDDSHFHGGHAAHDGKKKLVTWEGAEFDAEVNGVKLRDKAMELHTQFSPSWQFFSINVPLTTFSHGALTIHHMKATIGRRRFRNTNNTLGSPAAGEFLDTTRESESDPGNLGGDYFDLASNNLSHFAISNWSTWEHYHAQVCKLVDDAKNQSADEKKAIVDQALIKDAWGCHYLTDMFASGHVVNKQALMTEATSMMGTMAKDHGLAKGTETGEKKHAVLTDMLTESLQLAFRDDAVYEGWRQGCRNAFDQGLVRYDELELMLTIPRGTQWSTGMPSVVGNLVDTIMGMPWRDMQKNDTPGGDLPGGKLPDHHESFGPGNKDKGQGDYHLGVGNLAALTVHNALNEIGFEAKNGLDKTWRMQGDGHLTAATQAQAHAAVEASAQQVRDGKSDVDAVRNFTPTEVRMDPAWLETYISGRQKDGQQYNAAMLADVRAKAKALATFTPLNKDKDVSPELAALCSAIMKLEFTAPEGQYEALVKTEEQRALDGDGDGTASMNNTGVNVAFLRLFLIENLPRMVPVAYAAASAADLSSQALEVYRPRTDDGTVLPTGASDFAWNGDELTFNVNVTGCTEGPYVLGIQVHDQDGGNDYKPSGQIITEPLGRDDDEVYGTGGTDATAKFTTTITVPKDAAASPNGRTYVAATWSLKGKGDANHGEHYVRVFADAGCTMVIGRSSTKESGERSNPSAIDEAPRATGADRTPPRTEFNATGVDGNAFAWDGNSVRFRLKSAAPPGSGMDRKVRAWVKQFDRDADYDHDQEGREIPTEFFQPRDDDEVIQGPDRVDAPIVQVEGSQVSQQVVYTTIDDANDTYIIVYGDPDCTQPLARSHVQGTNRGNVRNNAPVAAASSVSGFSWSGNRLSFAVSPPSAHKVFVKLFDKDSGYDYSTGGYLLSGSRDEDEQYGGVREVVVNKGRASIEATGDAAHEDTYAIVYADPGCTTPLGRSNARD